MIIELKRLVRDEVFYAKYIKIEANNLIRSGDSYRIDLPDKSQKIEIEAAGYEVDEDMVFITIGSFIDNLYKIHEKDS